MFGGAVTSILAFKSWERCPLLVILTLVGNPVIRRAASIISSDIPVGLDVVVLSLLLLFSIGVLVELVEALNRTRRSRRGALLRVDVVAFVGFNVECDDDDIAPSVGGGIVILAEGAVGACATAAVAAADGRR